jgi:predicted short-subunit dehydrogenase-like oxidoreductase (DUF2520 family)
MLGPLIVRSRIPQINGIDPSVFVRFDKIDSISADVLVIATGDEEIRPVADTISTFKEIPGIVLHLSGSLGSEQLARLRERDVSIGSIHPLVSLSDPNLGADRFAGAYFCVEGDEKARDCGISIAAKLGGKHFSIESRFKPLYHASAVMASGNVVALFHAAAEMLSKCGLNESGAREVLLPLLQSTVANLGERSIRDALTGPFARCDAAALHRHLEAFDRTVDSSLLSIYLALAERSVKISGVKNSAELLDSISVAKRQTEC